MTGLRAFAALLFAVVAGFAFADQQVRIVTWNIETVGARDSAQYEAARAVLQRLDADIVALQEILSAADVEHLDDFAFDLGYAHVAVAPSGPFGSMRNALLSDYPIRFSDPWTSVELSGDADADDLTRYLFEA
ncbi:MAG: endonuclease/exonuclease/phosphatase family protein, partial [Thiohalocapsa sp.]